jgi:hypothetical protein
VLSGGTAELASADFNLFGARIEQIEALAAGSAVSRACPSATFPTAASQHAATPPGEPIYPQPSVVPPSPEPQSPDLMERVSSRLGKMAAGVTELRHKVSLPFTTGQSSRE